MSMTQPVSFVVHLPLKPEHREAFEPQLIAVLEQMSEEPDFIDARLHRSQDDPDTYVVYETWACTREHFVDYHLKRPYRRRFEAALSQRLRRLRTVEFLGPVRSFEPKLRPA